jgi:long-chain acyl-CoA synthetase
MSIGTAQQLVYFDMIAEALTAHRPAVLQALSKCETAAVAEREFNKTIRALETYGSELPHLSGRLPIGTAAVLLPFNNPLYSLVLYCFGPLLAGNRVLCRPSSLTGFVVAEISNLIAAELSSLDLTLDYRSGRDFITDASVHADCILFTGTWQNAETICAPLTRKIIYCGQGLNPFAILHDAPMKMALPTAITARLYNSGQDCLSAERFYVHSSRVTEFVAGITARIESITVGRHPDADIGPLVSVGAADAVKSLLDTVHPTRRIIRQGKIVGNLIEPIVIQTDQDDPITLTEKYAPVFVIVQFESISELNSLMNDSPYSFGATVFGVAELSKLSLKHPHIAINSCLLDFEDADAHVPFGGRQRSGFVDENGRRRDGPILFSIETSVAPNNAAVGTQEI